MTVSLSVQIQISIKQHPAYCRISHSEKQFANKKNKAAVHVQCVPLIPQLMKTDGAN